MPEPHGAVLVANLSVVRYRFSSEPLACWMALAPPMHLPFSGHRHAHEELASVDKPACCFAHCGLLLPMPFAQAGDTDDPRAHPQQARFGTSQPHRVKRHTFNSVDCQLALHPFNSVPRRRSHVRGVWYCNLSVSVQYSARREVVCTYMPSLSDRLVS